MWNVNSQTFCVVSLVANFGLYFVVGERWLASNSNINGHCSFPSCCPLSSNSGFLTPFSTHRRIPSRTKERFGQNHIRYNRRKSTGLKEANKNHSGDTEGGVNEKTLGTLVLLTVPVAWGTYAPVVRYVYELDPPVPGLIFSASYYVIAAVSLFLWMIFFGDGGVTEKEAMGGVTDENTLVLAPAENTKVTITKGGMELGTYLFLGNCLQVVGLKTVQADRASFLVQLTTIIVPFVQAFAITRSFRGEGKGDVAVASKGGFENLISLIPGRTWVACFMAFTGVVVMGLDNVDTTASSAVASENFAQILQSATPVPFLTTGDTLIILAAFAYSCHVVRLGYFAPLTTPMRLATIKATSESVLSVGLVWLLYTIGIHNGALFGVEVPNSIIEISKEISYYVSYTGDNIFSMAEAATSQTSESSFDFAILQSPPLLACLWTGWVTCAYTIYAQTYGQRRIAPTDANLIYSTQPLCSSIFAWFLLGERLGVVGCLGGALILGSLWLEATKEDGPSRDI